MTLSRRLPTLLLVLATTAGATYTILIAAGSGSLDVPALRLVYDAMAAAALLPWLVISVVRPDWRPRSQLLPAIGLVIVVFAISSATSRVPRLSFEMLGYAVLLAEVYLLLVALMRRPLIRAHLARLALVMCVVVTTLYVIEVVNAWRIWWDLVGRIAIPPLRPAYLGLHLSPNPLATVVLALGAFGLATSGFRGGPGRLVTAAVFLLVLAAVFISGSRGAWLGTALAIAAVVGAAVLVRPENRQQALVHLRSRSAVIALIVGAPVVLAGGALAAMSGRLSLDDGGFRDGFTRASLQMFQESPLTGVGPGTWGPLRASYTPAPDLDLYIPHAHSVYVQTLAEFGLAGGVAAVALVLALARLLWPAMRSPDPSRRRVGYAALFAIVVLAGQQYADMLMNVPAVVLSVVLPIAWLDATAQPAPGSEPVQPTKSITWRGALPLGAAVVTGVILIGLVRIEGLAGTASEGVDAALDQQWRRASDLAAVAADGDPDVALYQFQLGVSAANAGDLALAESALEAGAARDDYRYAWLDLAAVRWRLGDEPGARDALARAERLGLQRAALAVAAGWLRQQLGDADVATADYAAAVEQMPSLAGDPFWSSESGPEGGLDAILEIVGDRASPAAMLQIHLVIGDMALAQQDVDALAIVDPVLYPRLIPAWNGDEAAWTTLRAHAAARPLDQNLLSWCRFLAAYRGDRELVANYGVWLAIVSSPDALYPPIGRIQFDRSEELSASFLDNYGTLYRRQIPPAQVVNLLPQLVLQDHP